MKEPHELSDADKRKIESECAKAPVSSTANNGLVDDKAREDSWFHEHEEELMEKARKRMEEEKARKGKKSSEDTKDGADKNTRTGDDKPKPKCCSEG